MADKAHHYLANLVWSGASLSTARDYKSYSRAFSVSIPGKPLFQGSADPAFLGDPTAHNPEDLLLIALTSCHLLSYVALCANSGIVIRSYADAAEGTLSQQPDRNFAFSQVHLHPQVIIEPGGDLTKALRLHERAHEICFIARSVNFPVEVSPQVTFPAA